MIRRHPRGWDLRTGALRCRCDHGDAIFAVTTWNADRASAAAGGRAALLWDLPTGRRRGEIPIGGEDVHTFVASDAQSRRLVSVAPTGAVEIWSLAPDGGDPRRIGHLPLDLTAQRTVRRLPCHEDWIRDLRLTSDGASAITVCQDSALAVVDLPSGGRVATRLPQTRVAAIALTTDDTVAAVGVDGTVKVDRRGPPPRGR